MIDNIYSNTDTLRITGLASGLDTENIVNQLMMAEKMPLNRLSQKRQLAEWKMNDYRDITNVLRGFKDEFFNVLKPSTNMLSKSAYKKFSITSTNESVVSASANADAISGTHNITVTNLSTSAVVRSSSAVTKDIEGTAAADFVLAQGKDFVIDVDGISKTITIDSAINNAGDLQNEINTEFGSDKVKVEDMGGGILRFTAVSGSGVNKITLEAGETDALLDLGFDSTANLSNRLNISDSLEDMALKTKSAFTFDTDDELNLTINGETFEFEKSTTISQMINQINSNSNADVNMQYNEITDTFAIIAKQPGAGNNIKISETGSTYFSGINLDGVTGNSDASGALQDYTVLNKTFSINVDGVRKDIVLDGNYATYNDLTTAIDTKIETAFSGTSVSVLENGGILSIELTAGGSSLTIGEPMEGTSALSDLGIEANYTEGEDAEAVIDGETVKRGSNSFTIGGITYTLHSESAVEQTISCTMDVDGIYEGIFDFVEKYNETIGIMNDKISEEYKREYLPLTDEQKAEMSEEEIENWEVKAKTGLLRNDSLIENIVYKMRRAVSDSIEDVSGILADIGITTSGYMNKGKLEIDEVKLRSAIEDNPDRVMNIFSKESEIDYYYDLSDEDREIRYNESGIMQRLSDILEYNVGITGEKGMLLQKAGMEGDRSEYDNLLYKNIAKYDQEIEDMREELYDKEEEYYRKFSVVEKMIAQMNAQSEWMFSQLGMGQ
jgi:flagellar hook-associated protein 2